MTTNVKGLINEHNLKVSMDAAKRSGAAFGYGTYVDPCPPESPEYVDALRPSALPQWELPFDEFLDAVSRRWPEMVRGQAYQLMAGCGAGKTTSMAARLASDHSLVGIVALPRYLYVVTTLSYAQQHATKAYGMNGRVGQLTPQTIAKPTKAPAVYYTGIAEFLAFLAKDPSILEKLKVSFVYVDESHMKRGEMTILRYLVAAGKFAKTVLLYGSATAASDISAENNSMRTITRVSPSLLPPMPYAVPPRSPAAAENVQGRSIMFVADDTAADAWVNYYVQNDIPAMRYTESDGVGKYAGVPKFLETPSTRVLVTTSVIESCVTLPLESGFCLGSTTKMRSDFANGSIVLHTKAVTESSRVQRAGRVGRFSKGKFWYADVDVSPPETEDDPDVCAYVWLWARVFGLNIKTPRVARYVELFGNISVEVVSMLLRAYLPPLAMLQYFSDDGVAANWGYALQQAFRPNLPMHMSHEDNQSKVAEWIEMDTGPVDYAEQPLMFKSQVRLPDEWTVLHVYYWYLANGLQPSSSVLDDTATVIGSPPRVKQGSKPRFSMGNLRRAPSIQSIADAVLKPSPWKFDTDVPDVPPVPPYRSREPSLSTPPEKSEEKCDFPSRHQPGSRRPSVNGQIDTSRFRRPKERDNFEEWEPMSSALPNIVPASPPKKKSSSASSLLGDMVVRQVDPIKYYKHKLYPVDPVMCKALLDLQGPTNEDARRVQRLLRCKVFISSLDPNRDLLAQKQQDYFLSTLRIHNASVVNALQVSASRKSRNPIVRSPGFDDFMRDAQETSTLLKTFGVESHFVGIDARNQHADDSKSDGRPEENLKLVAEYAVAAAPKSVRDVIAALEGCVAPLYERNPRTYKANGWVVNGQRVTSGHAYESLTPLAKAAWLDDALAETSPITPADEYADAALANWLENLGVNPVDDVICITGTRGERALATRRPNAGEQLTVVAYIPGIEGVRPYGCGVVFKHDDVYVVDFSLVPGTSGALFVSLYDGSVVGMYNGVFMHIGTQNYSLCCPFPEEFY